MGVSSESYVADEDDDWQNMLVSSLPYEEQELVCQCSPKRVLFVCGATFCVIGLMGDSCNQETNDIIVTAVKWGITNHLFASRDLYVCAFGRAGVSVERALMYYETHIMQGLQLRRQNLAAMFSHLHFVTIGYPMLSDPLLAQTSRDCKRFWNGRWVDVSLPKDCCPLIDAALRLRGHFLQTSRASVLERLLTRDRWRASTAVERNEAGLADLFKFCGSNVFLGSNSLGASIFLWDSKTQVEIHPFEGTASMEHFFHQLDLSELLGGFPRSNGHVSKLRVKDVWSLAAFNHAVDAWSSSDGFWFKVHVSKNADLVSGVTLNGKPVPFKTFDGGVIESQVDAVTKRDIVVVEGVFGRALEFKVSTITHARPCREERCDGIGFMQVIQLALRLYFSLDSQSRGCSLHTELSGKLMALAGQVGFNFSKLLPSEVGSASLHQWILFGKAAEEFIDNQAFAALEFAAKHAFSPLLVH